MTPPGGHACSRDFVFALLRQSPQAPQACCAYRKLTGASAVETSLELLGGKVYNSDSNQAGRLDFPSRRQDARLQTRVVCQLTAGPKTQSRHLLRDRASVL